MKGAKRESENGDDGGEGASLLVGVRQVEGLGRKRFVLSADDDNNLRS